MTKIDLKNVAPKVVYVPPKILLYGRNGIGKSTFALKTPSPIFVDLDENIYELPCTSNKTLKIPINNYDDVINFLGVLFNQDHDFKTVVIDSLSSLEKLIMDKAVKTTNGITSFADFNYGKGHLKTMCFWEDFFQKIKNLWKYKKMIVIFLAHHKEKKEENLTGASYSQYQINLQDRASELLRNWCSCVLFADDEVIIGDEKSKTLNSTRIIRTDGGLTFLAKNTYKLPPKISLDWDELAQHVQKYYQQFNYPTEPTNITKQELQEELKTEQTEKGK